MKKNEFIESLLNDLRTLGYEFDQVEIIGQNDTKRKGFIYKNSSSIRPTLYFEDYYNEYQNGETVHDIASRIILCLERAEIPGELRIDTFKDYNVAKEYLRVGLVSTELSKEFLKDKPCMKMGEVTIVFYVCFRQDVTNDSATSWVNNVMKKQWNVNLCDLYSAAIMNSMKKDKPVMLSVQNLIMNYNKYHNMENSEKNLLTENSLDAVGLYVLTNGMRTRGASTILYDGLLASIADKLGVEILYIIPSSIHEVLLFSEPGTSEDVVCTELTKMIKDVNESALSQDEVLGMRPLIYRRREDKICNMKESY